MPDVMGDGAEVGERAPAPSRRGSAGERPGPGRHLDLGRLTSPVAPVWTTGKPALPFPPESFDSVLVGPDILSAAAAPGLLGELQRVLAAGGSLRFLLPTSVPNQDDGIPAASEVVRHVGEAFAVSAVDVTGEQVTIEAVNREPDETARYGTLLDALEELQRLALAVRRRDHRARQLGEELEQVRRELDRTSARVEEQRRLVAEQAKRVERLATLVGQLKESKLGVEAERAKAASQLRSARADLVKLQARLEQAEADARYERWRAEVWRLRKWTRIGEQVKILRRRPWSIFVVLYRIVGIVAGPSIVPRRPRSRSGPKDGNGDKSSAAHKVFQGGIDAQFPPQTFPDAPARRKLRVATILDEFSESAFKYEFDLMPVTRRGWPELFAKNPPDLLLVESAWNGNRGEWKYMIAGQNAPKQPLLDLLSYCRDNGIPTVFWNKEDPLEYDVFIRSARHFDWVFTVDENCVPKYRQDLGHDRIGVLPFGVQPRIHHPVGAFASRPFKVAFAGTHYSTKYPQRKQQLETVLEPCVDLGLHIFSRWESDPKYAFPEQLSGAVVGSLTYPQTLTAYRKYQVFLNVNSVTDSRTMFSRRVLELLACGTPVVSGPAIGIRSMLGEGVVEESTERDVTRQKVRALLLSSELRDRQAVKGIRAVMSGNTYSDRVDHMLRTIGLPVESRSRRVSVVAPTNRTGAYEQILDNVARQRHDDIELIIALHGTGDDEQKVRQAASERGIGAVEVLVAPSDWTLGRVLNEACKAATGDFIAKMDDDDFYAPNYLSDQLLAFDYTDADIVGKWTRFIYIESVPCLGVIFPGHEHRYTELVGGGTLLMKRKVLDVVEFEDRSVGEDTQFLRDCASAGFRTYSTDRFNFVYKRYSDGSAHTYRQSDLHHLSLTQVVSFGSALEHAVV